MLKTTKLFHTSRNLFFVPNLYFSEHFAQKRYTFWNSLSNNISENLVFDFNLQSLNIFKWAFIEIICSRYQSKSTLTEYMRENRIFRKLYQPCIWWPKNIHKINQTRSSKYSLFYIHLNDSIHKCIVINFFSKYPAAYFLIMSSVKSSIVEYNVYY